MHWKRALQKARRKLTRHPSYLDQLSWPHSPPNFDKSTYNFTVDFELFWGNGRDGNTDLSLERRIRSAKAQNENFTPFLKMLEELGLSVSWAIAGIMAQHEHPNKNSAFSPTWAKEDWYRVPSQLQEHTSLWMGHPYLGALKESSVPQEILSHGYAHIDYSDAATNTEVALFDLKKAHSAIESFGFKIEGFVYPCNQVGHLPSVESMNYKIIRGDDHNWHIGEKSVRTPIGFWISPGVMSWSELRPALDFAIEQKAFIHPWMHLNECDLSCRDIEEFYHPLFEYLLMKEKEGVLVSLSYRKIKDHFFLSNTSE